MELIVQILLALTFIFFCVLTYYFTKTWRALHVVTVFLTFIMTIVLALMTAMTLSPFRNIFGGNIRSYESLLDRAKREAIIDITRALETDRLVHRVSRVFPLSGIADAHELIEQGGVRGCVQVNVAG